MAMLLFDSTAAGWVTMSYRLAMFPSDILCGSVSLVLARRIADSVFHHPERLMADRRLLSLFLAGNFVLFGLLGLAIWLGTDLLLGAEWAGAAVVMSLMASIGLSFTIQPTVTQVLGLLGSAAESMWITVVHVLLLTVGAALTWWQGFDLQTAIAGLAALEILLSASLTWYVLQVTKTAVSSRSAVPS
jgi:O-antigen/teichoic acid export membrane protein